MILGPHELPPELAILQASTTIVTSTFLLGRWMQLIGNMLFQWIFGDNVEKAMSHARFSGIYLLCGGAAAFAQVLPNPHSTVPMIGASGPMSGVLGAYFLLFQRARILVLIPIGFFLFTVRLLGSVVLIVGFAVHFLSSALAGERV